MKYLLPLLLLATAGTATAETVYRCDMTHRGNGGWVDKVMFFQLDPQNGTGWVMDGVVKNVQDLPMPAQVTKRSDAIWIYRWRVEDVRSSNSGEVTLSYRAQLNVSNGRLTLSGRLQAYDNNISGVGRCQVSGES